MSTIKALLSKNANYINHMLSVAKCGYDNAYGEKYKTCFVSCISTIMASASYLMITVIF